MKALIITIAVLLLASLPAAAQEYERTVKESFKTTSSPSVVIDSRFGSVDVRAGGGNTASVIVRVIVDVGSEAKARKLAEATRVEIKGSSDKVTVRTALPDGMDEEDGEERNISIDINVTVPEGSRVKLQNKFGDVDVAGVKGSVEVQCSFGSIEVKNCSNVRAESSFGNMSFAAIDGKIEAQGKMGKLIAYDIPGGKIASSYGDVEINGVKGRLEVTSSMGSMSIKGMRSGEISSSYGSVDVTLDRAFSGRIEASTSFGSINSEVELKSKEKKRSPGQMGEKKYGTVGSGSDRLVIKSSFGDVGIEKP